VNGKIRTQAAHAPPPPRRGRGWLVVTLLLLLLAASATGGAWWWRIRAASADQAKNLAPDPDSRLDETRIEGQQCSDDSDPKFLEGLEFGPPVEVSFRRATLDALSDRPIPPLEVFPWQPRGLVAVLGEHRMRGFLLAASPDGKQLAIGSQGSAYVRIGPVETLREAAVIACPAAARTMNWSPTGRSLAVACDDGVVRLHDVGDLDAIPAPVAMEKVAGAGLITCLSFSSDGKYLLGGDDTALRGVGWVWDVSTRKVVKQLVHIGPVASVAFSPVAGDYRALTAGGPQDGQMHLWDALIAKETATIDFRRSKTDTTTAVGDVAFSADAKRALSCHPDGLVRVWDLARFEKGKESHTYGGHAGTPLAAFSPNGEHVATSRWGDGGVWLWDAKQAKQVRRLATPGGVYALRFLGDDRVVFTGTISNDQNVHLHEVATGKEIQPPTGHLTGLTSVALSPEGGVLGSAGADYAVRLWGLKDGKQRYALATGNTPRVGFHPDGRRVYHFSLSLGVLPFADVETGQATTPAYDTNHGGGILSAAITGDGRYALTGGHHEGSVRMWRLKDGKQVRRFDLGPSQGPATITLAPDMRRALRVGGGTTRLLHLRCQQVRHEWPGFQGWAPFLPDGRAAFFGGANTPVWKITQDDPKEVGQISLDLSGVQAGQISADGKRVAAVLPGKVAVFDLTSGELKWDWTPPPHFGGIAGVALSADGGHLATANGDGTAYVVRLP
jgi:WD40 repeat protein